MSTNQISQSTHLFAHVFQRNPGMHRPDSSRPLVESHSNFWPSLGSGPKDAMEGWVGWCSYWFSEPKPDFKEWLFMCDK